MTVNYTKTFKKQHNKLPTKQKQQFSNRLRLFIEDPYNPILRIHPLKGKLGGYFSLSVSGDIRAIFKKSENSIIFILIGTHSQIY